MLEKPTALVVDDDDEWLSILEEALMPRFRVLKAKTLQDVIKILDTENLKLEIALVDFRLDEKKEQDRRGLDVMFILNEQGVPCIGATARNDGMSTRYAILTGGAKDIWFKEETLVILRDKIKSVTENEKNKRGNERDSSASQAAQSMVSLIDPKLVFVIMPFGEKWSDEVWLLIKSVAEKLKLNAVRADNIFTPTKIVEDIRQLIERAGIIIADITVHNANVFYELGIAHAIEKEVILLRGANGENPPFDVSHWRYFEYELMPSKAKEFKDKLSKALKDYRKKHNI